MSVFPPKNTQFTTRAHTDRIRRFYCRMWMISATNAKSINPINSSDNGPPPPRIRSCVVLRPQNWGRRIFFIPHTVRLSDKNAERTPLRITHCGKILFTASAEARPCLSKYATTLSRIQCMSNELEIARKFKEMRQRSQKEIF